MSSLKTAAKAATILAGSYAAALTLHAQAWTLTVQHDFLANYLHGSAPVTDVVRGPAGDLYGTTLYGGPADFGVIYKVSSAGKQTVLYSFNEVTGYNSPTSGVVFDSSGNLYGAATSIVYKLDAAGQFTVLHTFGSLPGGVYPQGGLICDPDGNLYSTTYRGGPSGLGVLYKLSPSGVETVLHSFQGGGYTDGEYPTSGVFLDSSGNLYGATASGGADGAGTLYEYSKSGVYTVLFQFPGFAGGAAPTGVVPDAAGNLYGSTSNGGASEAGTVFQVDSAGHETVLYNLAGGAAGSKPSKIVRDSAGNIYGTAQGNYGLVFQVDSAGNETTLYQFSGGADGSTPEAGVTLDSSGKLYGTTSAGGSANNGTAFAVSGLNQESVVYSFASSAGGSEPLGMLVRDSSGNIYGTAAEGGPGGGGTIYKFDTTGHETVVHAFGSGPVLGVGGENPHTGVTLDSAGNLYGTTLDGDVAIYGNVFKIDPAGTETVLATFLSLGPLGANPDGGVLVDGAGNVYGTTELGGSFGSGVLFKIDPSGKETVLYNFKGDSDAWSPTGNLVADSSGNLYGTTYRGGTSNDGTVFKVTPSGQETVLYSFTDGADGYSPTALARDTNGNFYGVTAGGAANTGTIFRLSPSGQETVLYTFTGGIDGAQPGSILLDYAGNIYGTTTGGGNIDTAACANYTPGCGVVFELSPTGQETVLYSFTGGADGEFPEALLFGAAGSLQGTAGGGGRAVVGDGVIFKLTPP